MSLSDKLMLKMADMHVHPLIKEQIQYQDYVKKWSDEIEKFVLEETLKFKLQKNNAKLYIEDEYIPKKEFLQDINNFSDA